MVFDKTKPRFMTFSLIMAAFLPQSCGLDQLGKTTNSIQFSPDPGEDSLTTAPCQPQTISGTGILRVANSNFPQEAERLVLTISTSGPAIPEGSQVFPCDDQGNYERVPGMGLKPPSKPQTSSQPLAQETEPTPVLGSGPIPILAPAMQGRSFHVMRGEDVKPIRLFVGSYHVEAVFFNSSKLIYKGSAKFEIVDGQQTSVKILLKKVKAAEVTIDFEVENPSVLSPENLVDIVAIYEGSSNHFAMSNVRVRVSDESVALSLSSYESVNWQIIGGANLRKIILSGYKKQTASHSTKAIVSSYCYEGGCTYKKYPDALSARNYVSKCNDGWFYDMSCSQKNHLLNWLRTTALQVENIGIRSEQGAYTAPAGGFYLP
jgi:hypothetical protein